MRKIQAMFETGDRVLIANGEIEGTIERIILCRGMDEVFYLVEWWKDGEPISRELHEADITSTLKEPF